MKKIAVLLALLASSLAHAAIIDSPTSKIKMMGSYNQYAGGDVYFAIENPAGICTHGYWLNKADAGFGANMAMLLSAYHAKSNVMIYAHNDQIWPGSTGTYCKLYSVVLN